MHKKIAIFEDGNGFGGSVFALLENMRYLSSNKDIEFLIIHSLKDSRFNQFTTETHCKLHFNGVKNWKLSNPWLNTFFKRGNLYLAINTLNSYKVLRLYKPDLVYTNNDLECNLHAIIASKLLNLPVVSHERDIPSFWSKTTKLFYNSVETVIAISEATQQAIIKQTFPPEKIIKIVDGIDTHRLINDSNLVDPVKVKQQHELPLDKKIILMIGMITKWKGQHIVLQAVQQLHYTRSNLHFVFIGEEPTFDQTHYLDNLYGYITNNCIQNDVSILGYCSNIGALIKASDLVIHASISPEPFGRVIVESMSLAKPIIATNIGGPQEIISDGETGFLIEPSNPTKLANKINEVIDTPEKSKKIANAAQKFALAHYDSKLVAYKIGELLKLYLHTSFKDPKTH